MSQIVWNEEFDDQDNSVWVGHGPYAEHFCWRLRQEMWGNTVFWVAHHDHELGGETGQSWETLERAKETCQSAHNLILQTCEVDS